MWQVLYELFGMIEFNYIRNKIRKYSKDSLLNSCLEILRKSETPQFYNIAIWDIFLVLKWTMIYAEQSNRLKIADQLAIQRITEDINKLRMQHSLFSLNKNPDLIKVLSLLTYHQSYLQFTVWEDCFSRQMALFSRKQFNDWFLTSTGISIHQFTVLSFILWVYTSPKSLKKKNFSYNGLINSDFIDIASKFETNDIVIKFLDLLSIRFDDMDKLINNGNNIVSPVFQTFEITVFAKFPFLLYNNNRIVIHKKLLNYTINFFIYDYLKEYYNEKFTEQFGEIFEKYIEFGLKEISANYKTEKKLKTELPTNSKCVDFIVDDDILIECKAIELKPYPSVNPNNEVIYSWLKGSVVKAYSQQMMTIANLISSTKIKYGIIITYKETYFGNGYDAWESFLKEPTEEFARKENLNISLLPPSNLFFVDISTWDRIVQIIKEKDIALKEILDFAKKNNEDKLSTKFSFRMHIENIETGPLNVTYLEKIDKIIDFNLIQRK